MGAMPLLDQMFLLAEARERPMHVGGLHLYKPPPEAPDHYAGELYRDIIQRKDIHPRLLRRPVRIAGAGPWAWETDEHLDLEYHVRHSALPHPGRIRELLALVSRLHGSLLDRSRPLWEAHLIEGLEDGRIATYVKIHHAVMDGVSAMRLLERGLTSDPDARDMPPPLSPSSRSRPPKEKQTGLHPLRMARSVAGAGLEGMKGLVGASDATVRSIITSFSDQASALPYSAPASPLNVNISSSRRFAADDWAMDRLKSVGKALGGTLNDVVLAMSAGALRRYLLDIDGLPENPLVAMVPVSLRGEADDEDDEGTGNAVGLILCNLGTHLSHPVDRFELIHRSAETGKLQLRGLNQAAIMLLGAASVAPLGLGPLQRVSPRPPFNIVISNVPGPKERLYWNGAELDGVYPASIPVDGQALNITCTSWHGRVGFGLTGCRRSVPSLQRLLDHLDTSLVELEEAV